MAGIVSPGAEKSGSGRSLNDGDVSLAHTKILAKANKKVVAKMLKKRLKYKEY